MPEVCHECGEELTEVETKIIRQSKEVDPEYICTKCGYLKYKV